MNNSTILDGLLFDYTTDVNNTLLFPIPVSTIVTVTVCSFGIIANFLVLLVINLTSLRTSVFMNLIMYLAIVDTMFLFSAVHALRGIFGELLIKPSLLYCRFTLFFIYVTGIVSSWVTVLISFERYIAIFYPFKVHIYCTKKRMLVAVIIITILACTSQIPFFFTCSLIFIGQRPKCLSFVRDTWIEFMFIFFLFMIYSFVPLIIITVLNVLLLRKNPSRKCLQGKITGSAFCVNIFHEKCVSNGYDDLPLRSFCSDHLTWYYINHYRPLM